MQKPSAIAAGGSDGRYVRHALSRRWWHRRNTVPRKARRHRRRRARGHRKHPGCRLPFTRGISPTFCLRRPAYSGVTRNKFLFGLQPHPEPPGPKSRDAASPAIKAHSRPCHLVWAPTVAGHWTAKHRRAWTYSTGGFGPAQMKPPVAHSHAVGKRSFRRACRRVVEQGVTKYRGQILTAGQLSSAQIHRAQAMIHRQKARAVRPPQHIPAAATGRQRVLVWNSGGLAYQDFMHWLAHQSPPIDVAIILETRMAHNMEHTTGEYIVMHSAGPHAGVMIVIRKAITPVHRVTWRTVEEGRLVHVRVYGSTGHLNIIGYYQQAWQPTKVEACTKERSRLNAKLESLLAECSNNQLLLLGGDFNTDLAPDHPHVGPATGAATATRLAPAAVAPASRTVCPEYVPQMAADFYGYWSPWGACQQQDRLFDGQATACGHCKQSLSLSS